MFTEELVAYYSRQSKLWVVHGLESDQLAAGRDLMKALVAFVKVLRVYIEEEDITKMPPSTTPDKIRKMVENAIEIPEEIMNISEKMAIGTWDEDIKIIINPKKNRKFRAEYFYLLCLPR